LRPGPFAPGELLRSVVTMLKADTAVSGATVVVETDPELSLPLLGDAGRIQQILVNYVSNALKYAGGNIRLTATVPHDSPGEVEFAVTDQGAGISEPDQSTLFTKFTRLPSAQRSEVTGSGLGLASCRLLADLMGGSVGVESSPGNGARFYLRLPIVAAIAPAEPVKLSLANTSVLLVEDADYNAWAASAVLAKLGLSCERARTGQEALRLFAEKRFNLVLLDRNLPDMDGTVVARQIRALESDGPRAILLAVTAYCTPQDRALCLDAGMDAFVGKPLTPDKLRKILIAAGRRLLTAASMHVSPSAAAPVIDVSLLDYMSDGTEQGLRDQVTCFLAAMTEGEARLTKAYQARDFDSLAYAAHYLLSHAKLVGSAALEDAAVNLERAARSQDRAAFVGLLHRVHREIRALTEAMSQYRPAELPA
jgi:CheY-like chemotaxis protein/anti-sigma regulatory factor (Ser/Thr protein kinase)